MKKECRAAPPFTLSSVGPLGPPTASWSGSLHEITRRFRLLLYLQIMALQFHIKTALEYLFQRKKILFRILHLFARDQTANRAPGPHV